MRDQAHTGHTPQLEQGLHRPGLRWGTVALVSLLAGTLAMVLWGAGGASIAAPHPGGLFPSWLAGPLAHVLPPSVIERFGTQKLYSALLAVMFGAYLIAVASADSLTPGLVIGFVVASAAILFLGPPTRLNDVFNYLGYGRLGADHGLNPYTHVIRDAPYDPVLAYTSWRNLKSPYGPLFTAFTYPLAKLSLPGAYWTYKACAILADLVLVWLVGRCADALGHDWRRPVLFIAANPIYLFFEVAGFHNDFLMLVPATAAVLLVLRRRDLSAGVAIMLAVAVKFTALILAPFLLIAAANRARRSRLALGMLVGAVPMLLLSLALFGTSVPNLSEQSGLVTGYSVPNLLGLALGLGGATPVLVRLLEVAVVVCVIWRLRGTDWITSAAGCTLALIASIAWLMPWYLVWVLPLAALSTNRRLRWAALAATLFLLITFAPSAGRFFDENGLNPMNTPVGHTAQAFQQRLEADPTQAAARRFVLSRPARSRRGPFAGRRPRASRSA